jgi:anti-sigma regulatory factor (Ser/Thr protein kinase)
MRLELHLERTPDSAAEARRALADVADQVSARRLEDARLLVSELVTNAIRHAGLSDSDRITLIFEVDEDLLRIEVCDPGPGFDLSEPTPDPARPSGWAL